MARAPLQVLIFPYRRAAAGGFEYAIFRRSDGDYWQGLAGGAEAGESSEQAARREMMEEAGIPPGAPLLALDSMATVPAFHFSERRSWGPDVYVVPERAFGVLLAEGQTIVLSREHADYRWVSCEDGMRALRWDSNKTALWELNERLGRGDAEQPQADQ